MPKYKRVTTKHQEPRDQSVTRPGRGGGEKLRGDWPERGEPRKANQGPLEAWQTLRGDGLRLGRVCLFQGGRATGPEVSGPCLQVQPCYSLWDRATEKRLAGAGIATGQARKTSTEEREDPGQSGGREEREALRKRA